MGGDWHDKTWHGMVSSQDQNKVTIAVSTHSGQHIKECCGAGEKFKRLHRIQQYCRDSKPDWTELD